jgi:hypothetical protein
MSNPPDRMTLRRGLVLAVVIAATFLILTVLVMVFQTLHTEVPRPWG